MSCSTAKLELIFDVTVSLPQYTYHIIVSICFEAPLVRKDLGLEPPPPPHTAPPGSPRTPLHPTQPTLAGQKKT